MEDELKKLAEVIDSGIIKVKGNGRDFPLFMQVDFSRASDKRWDFFCAQCVKYSRETSEKIQRRFQQTKPGTSNSVHVVVDKNSSSVRFGPLGKIRLNEELRRKGIGSYLMAQVILWAKERYPGFRVERGELPRIHEDWKMRGKSPETFYRRQNFDVDESGFEKNRLDELYGIWDKDKVTEIPATDLLARIVDQCEAIESLQSQMKYQDSELRQTKEKLVRSFEFNIVVGGLLVIAVVALLYIINLRSH